MEPYNTWLWSASFTWHNTPKFHPCCSTLSVIHPFLLPNNIPLYRYTTFYLSIDQLMDMGCFYFLATVNNATMNFHIQAFMWNVFSFLLDIPRNKVAVSYGISIFNLLKSYKIVTGAPFYIPTGGVWTLDLISPPTHEEIKTLALGPVF